MDLSFLKDPDVLKVAAPALGLGAGVFAVIEKLMSRKKQPAAPVNQTLIIIGGTSRPLELPLFKKI